MQLILFFFEIVKIYIQILNKTGILKGDLIKQ